MRLSAALTRRPSAAGAAVAAHPPLVAALAQVAHDDARRERGLAAAATAAFAALARHPGIKAGLSELGVGVLVLELVAGELMRGSPGAPRDRPVSCLKDSGTLLGKKLFWHRRDNVWWFRRNPSGGMELQVGYWGEVVVLLRPG